MSYRALPTHLHPTADRARAFFASERGVSKIVVEEEVHAELNLRPTLQGRTRDHHIVCVEVTDSGYTDNLDSFVLDSQRLGLPVKLYIAVPAGSPPDIAPLLRRAKPRGIGVLEVRANGTCHIFVSALSLSLTGLRRLAPKRFPARYQHALIDAEETFLNGDPAKGCSRIYDEIEALSRRLAARVAARGLLRPSARAQPNFEKAPWKTVLEHLRTHLNYRALPSIHDQLLSRVIGLTDSRNQTGHKVTRRQDLMRRDSQLRTRFEDAVDVMEALVSATRGLRL
jgi:hypothetical protein